jgi:Fe-S-cluster containining protein
MSAAEHLPCATCGACCRSYSVPVCGYDIWLINKRQRLSPEQYVIACPQPEMGFDGVLLESGGQPYGLALDKQGRFAVKQPCVFLLRLADGNVRCGIYADRPLVCQAYPMSMWSGVVFQGKQTLCPPDSWPAREPQRPHWRATLHRLHMQFDLYQAVVTRWNARVTARPGTRFTLHEYFSYVLNVYDRLDALATATGPETLAGVLAGWPLPPRRAFDLDTLRRQGANLLWIDYFRQAGSIIDSFYPEVPPQPLHLLEPSSMPAAG